MKIIGLVIPELLQVIYYMDNCFIVEKLGLKWQRLIKQVEEIGVGSEMISNRSRGIDEL